MDLQSFYRTGSWAVHQSVIFFLFDGDFFKGCNGPESCDKVNCALPMGCGAYFQAGGMQVLRPPRLFRIPSVAGAGDHLAPLSTKTPAVPEGRQLFATWLTPLDATGHRHSFSLVPIISLVKAFGAVRGEQGQQQ